MKQQPSAIVVALASVVATLLVVAVVYGIARVAPGTSGTPMASTSSAPLVPVSAPAQPASSSSDRQFAIVDPGYDWVHDRDFEHAVVRESTTKNARPLCEIARGSRVDIFGTSRRWFKVRCPNESGEGWIHTDMLGFDGKPSPARLRPQHETSDNCTNDHRAIPTFETRTKQTANPKVKTSYPAFTFDCERASATVNGDIEHEVLRRVKEFRDGCVDAPDGAACEVEIACTQPTVLAQLVSVSCSEVGYAGGAHPYERSFAFNFAINGASARRLTLDDLIADGKRARLDERLTWAVNAEKEKRYPGSAGNVSISMVSTAKSTFVLRGSSLVVTFDAYVLGGGAEGPYEVILPYTSLDGLLRPDGPIAKIQHR